MKLLEKLKPHPKNPRRISDEKMLDLKLSIQAFPQMLEKRPIVYDENFIIIGGQRRYEALKALVKDGFEVKESYFQSAADWTEQQKEEFMIKDNYHSGEWDIDILRQGWADKPLNDWGLDFLGWNKQEVGGVNHVEGDREGDGDLMIPENEYNQSTSNTVVLVFDNEEYIQYMTIMKELIEAGDFTNPAEAVLKLVKDYYANNQGNEKTN